MISNAEIMKLLGWILIMKGPTKWPSLEIFRTRSPISQRRRGLSSMWNLCITWTNSLSKPWPLHPGARSCHAAIHSTQRNLLPCFTLLQDTSWSTRQHLLRRIHINEETISCSCQNHHSLLRILFPFSRRLSHSIHILCVVTGCLCLEISWFNRYSIHVSLLRNLLT